MPRKINEAIVAHRKHQTRIALEDGRVDKQLVDLVATMNRLKNCGVVASDCGKVVGNICRVSFVWTLGAAVEYGSVMVDKILRLYESNDVPTDKWPQQVTRYGTVVPDGGPGPIRSLVIKWESDWDIKFFCNMIIDLIEREYEDYLDWE